MVEIEVKDGQSGYSEVSQYVERYWNNNNVWEDTIVALETSYDNEKWWRCNDVVTPCDRGVEWLHDWWEGEKYIRVLGIQTISELDITGGIYVEDSE